MSQVVVMNSLESKSFPSVYIFIFSWVVCLAYPSIKNESSPPCEILMSVEIPNVTLHENGSAWDPDGSILYPSGTHWKVEEGTPSHRGCPCNIANNTPCLRKCCPIGEVPTKSGCIPMDHPFTFDVKNEDGDEVSSVNGSDHFALLYGNPCSTKRFLLEPDEFWIRASDGALIIPDENMTEYGTKDFCFDYFEHKNLHLPLMCVPPDAELSVDDSDSLVYIIYPIFMIFSTVFLLATFLVYSLIPELRNLHGKSLMSHVGSLIMTYVFLSTVQLGGKTISDGICIASAFIVLYFFLATFFWLNIMCIDICLTFSGLRPLPGSVKQRENKKFLIYSLYAWGSPMVILIIALIMDFAPGIPGHYLKPRFGLSKCWFDRKIDALTFFFGPIAFLITANVILFTITAVKMIQFNKQTAILKKSGSGSSEDDDKRNRFNLCLKLLIVMGVNWAMEVISWAIGGSEYLWYLTDIGNILQGFFIFLIFVWKNKIRNIAIEKLCPKIGRRQTHDRSMSYKWRGTQDRTTSKFSGTKSTESASFSSDDMRLKSVLKVSSVDDED